MIYNYYSFPTRFPIFRLRIIVFSAFRLHYCFALFLATFLGFCNNFDTIYKRNSPLNIEIYP